jgi:hypothetical protein
MYRVAGLVQNKHTHEESGCAGAPTGPIKRDKSMLEPCSEHFRVQSSCCQAMAQSDRAVCKRRADRYL